MEKTARQPLLDKRILQVCIVTDEVERINANWAKLIGTSFSGCIAFTEFPENGRMFYMGKATRDVKYQTNTFDFSGEGKSMQFEIMQALSDQSEWYDFMQERGRGIHHIAFGASEYEKTLENLEKEMGITQTQEGTPYPSTDSSFAYLSTKMNSGGTIELLGFGQYAAAAERYRQTVAKFSLAWLGKKTPISRRMVSAVTLIVPDAESSSAYLAKLFGIEPPQIREEKMDLIYLGEEKTVSVKCTEIDLINSVLEIVEVLEGVSAWSDYARKWERGYFSIAFEVADLAEAISEMEPFGLTVMQQGKRANGVEYALFDGMKDYSAVIELRTSPAIREKRLRIEQEEAERVKAYGGDLKYNESTPMKEIIANEHICEVLEKYRPGFVALTRSNQMSYRMPLGLTLRGGDDPCSEETIKALIQEINK